jgi:hypothetical protein
MRIQPDPKHCCIAAEISPLEQFRTTALLALAFQVNVTDEFAAVTRVF